MDTTCLECKAGTIEPTGSAAVGARPEGAPLPSSWIDHGTCSTCGARHHTTDGLGRWVLSDRE